MTDVTVETQTGACRCGAEVSRPVPQDGFADFVRKMPFVCQDCMDREAAESELREVEFEHDLRIRREQRRFIQSGMPASLTDLRLDQRVPAREVFAAQDWLRRLDTDDEKRGLLLTGNVGVGKTYLAASAAGTLLQQGRQLRWLTGPLMLARLGAGMGSAQAVEVIETLTGGHALVLDDLDKARPTPYGAEQVFLAVDQHMTAGAPLLVTTNLSVAELCDLWPDPFGEAIASRLAGYCAVVHMDGPDRRMA